MCPSWFPVFSTVIACFAVTVIPVPHIPSHTTCDDFMNKLFAFNRNMSLGRLWFYPHGSHWLFQACSVCATAHVKSHAAMHQVEEDHGIYGTALKVCF